MKKTVLSAQSRLWTVRADTSIMDCVKILREQNIGALIILSDNIREEIVGVFTERDVVKHLQLINDGSFWKKPVRTVMTTRVRTIDISEISKAPEMMITHNIRHLPVVSSTKAKKLVGVLSQRDIFRFVMEQYNFNLDKVFTPRVVVPKRKKKIIGAFSKDLSLIRVLEKGAQLTKTILVHSNLIVEDDLDSLEELMDRFDGLLIDLDSIDQSLAHKIISIARQKKRDHLLYLVFNPILLNTSMYDEVVQFAKKRRVHLFSKPIALGLLYGRFFRELR